MSRGSNDDPFGLELATPRRQRVFEFEGGVPGTPVPPGYVPPPPPSAPVEVIEPTWGWWRKAGAFGQRFQDFPPRLPNTVVALTEQLNLPGPPAPWWFSFFRFNRNQGAEGSDSGNWEFRARLLYGVGGALNTIDVDLIQGVQFGLVCNSVTVQLVSYTPTLFAAGQTADQQYDGGDQKVTVGCMFGKGGAANGSLPPTYTTPWEQKADGGPLVIQQQVPDYARSVAVHTTATVDSELQGMSLSFSDLGGQLLQEVRMGYAQGYSLATREKGIPIPAGTNTVSLTLSDPTVSNGTRAALQFFLAL